MDAPALADPATETPRYEGSHRVIVNGDRVTVCAVSVFCAFDPRIDPDSADGIKPYTNDKVHEIARETRERMKKGQFPRVVLRHEMPGRTVDPCAIGRMPRVWEEMRDGVAHIVADIEMTRSAFEEYLLSDAYPRRSAEFEPTEAKYLMNVALLGREAPGRPLEDTRYTFSMQSREIERPMPRMLFRKPIVTAHDAGVGGGANVYTPGLTEDKSMHEDETNKDDPMQSLHEAIGNLSKMCETEFGSSKTRFEALEARMTKYEAGANGENTDNGEDDELNTQHESAPARRGRRSRSKETPPGFVPQTQFESLKTQLDAQRDTNAALHEQVTEFAQKFRTAEAEKLVDSFIANGRPSQKPNREVLIAKFAALEGAALKTEFDLMSKMVRPDPVGTQAVHSLVGHMDPGHAAADAGRKLTDPEKIALNSEAVRMFEAAVAAGDKSMTLAKCRAEARRTMFAS